MFEHNVCNGDGGGVRVRDEIEQREDFVELFYTEVTYKCSLQYESPLPLNLYGLSKACTFTYLLRLPYSFITNEIWNAPWL